MKLKRMAALLVIIPAVMCGAAEHNNTLTIKGEAYNSCTVSWPSALNLGAQRSKNWVVNNNYLPSSSTVNISLSDCDSGTKARVTMEGSYSNANKYFLTNLKTEATLLVSLQVYNNAELAWKTLPLDKSEYVEFDTSTVQKIQLRGFFRRLDNNVRPVGEFKATPTIILTFL
ncbi:fimbrial protein [Klebsiella oxytoca]|uniref:fimbrial protein n=1 Tax=Klebsiella oxytoca TaxID=571 RepID=UPI0034D2B9D6